jgi:hypothetical protein
MSVNIRKFQVDDLLAIHHRPELPVDEVELRRFGEIHAASAASFTITNWEGNVVLACCGIDDMWSGVGQWWAIFGVGSFNYPGMYRQFRRLVERLWQDFGYRRWQMPVPIDDRGAMKVVEYIGLRPEGTMEGYGPDGTDHVLYAKVK